MSEDLIQEFAQSSQLGGGNADYVEHLYEAWLYDADSVPAEWRGYFEGLKGREAGDVPHSLVIERIERAQKRLNGHAAAIPASEAHAQKQAGVLKLITAYRSRGHLAAHLDPLGLSKTQPAPDLELAFHGLSDADLDTDFATGTFADDGPRLPLRDLLSRLRLTYTGHVGAEFMHISDAEERRWIYGRLEKANGEAGLVRAEQRHVLERLTAADGLERYLHSKYVGQKRFSLEGGESLIPLIDDIVRRGGQNGVREFVIGMAHRGRLNLLVNVLGKPPHRLFDEFEGKLEHADDPAHSGDVKYHMGFSADVKVPGGPVHLALAFNPSHLEIVDPVVAGSVRARQTRQHDSVRERVLPVLVHGDAAFTGQGVVAELFNMSQTHGFGVGGTLHVVINNQIGFTTSDPHDARSTLYCTDIAKMVNAPVLHVNGDDPEAVVMCARLAYDFRQRFNRDVVIDLVCYRRHGHNEADEPAATQPIMYHAIREHPTTRKLYADSLAEAGILQEGEADEMSDAYRSRLEAGEPLADLSSDPPDAFTVDWSPYMQGSLDDAVDTGVKPRTIKPLLKTLLTPPDDFKLQSRVANIYEVRAKMAAGKQPLDWGFAENLAYACLIKEGYNLRLVGQDTARGTFFHRQAVLHDEPTGRCYTPLQHIREDAHVEVIDSVLSEEAVMAFEYGYSTADPQTLNIWEAQFGDFANGAQVVIDQFISSGEAKWDRLCGLVLYLPHGYEGQGPEHSSARLERYLQLCALNNMQVCVPTTPAQAFHMIRRQMLRKLRKPLIVMTPKSLLRHKRAVSSLEELTDGSFQQVIGDDRAKPLKNVERVVLCAGKVYYDLLEQAGEQDLDQVALVRVEQLYPFPREQVMAELGRYKSAGEVIWCQEEPMNQGAWFQIRHHLQACISERHSLSYAGRPRSPVAAAGHYKAHLAEQKALVEQALIGPIGDDYASD